VARQMAQRRAAQACRVEGEKGGKGTGLEDIYFLH
jgi:hypothetical protein